MLFTPAMLRPERAPRESFAAYRTRRAACNKLLRLYLGGRLGREAAPPPPQRMNRAARRDPVLRRDIALKQKAMAA
jgi:hypothetical protein